MSAREAEEKKQVDAVQIELVHSCVCEIAEEFDPELEALIDKESKKNNDENQKRKMSMAFVMFTLKTALGISDEEALECLTDGFRDFGIDGIHIGNITDDEFEITIAQGKYVFDPNKAQDSIFPENDGVNVVLPSVRFIAKRTAEIPANPRLAKRIEVIRSLQAERVPRIRVLMCNNGLKWSSDAQRRIDLENFGDHVSWEHVNPDRISQYLTARIAKPERLKWTGKYFIEEFDGIRAIVGRMKVSEIAALVTRCGDSLFDPNVRGFLGFTRSRVNKEIQETLKSSTDRKNFYLYNNGLTMVCQKVKFNPQDDQDLMTPVTGIYVINGGQTCKAIQATYAEAAVSGEDLDEATVLVRLYEVPEEDAKLMSRIALSTNSQNPVDLRDLRSGDSIQRGLENAVQSYGYSYHRFRADKIVRGARKLPAPLAAEAVLAVWRRMPFEAAAHKQQHFSDKYYQKIFSVDLTAGQLILATKILRSANSRAAQKSEICPICLHGSHVLATVMGALLLMDISCKIEDLQREGFEKADQYFEHKEHSIFDRALTQLESAIRSYSDDDAPYGDSDLPKLFRKVRFVKGHLLKQVVGGAE